MTWEISPPALTNENRLWTVRYIVGGEPLFFQSKTELVPAVEGVISALLTQSLARNEPLAVHEPVDAKFAKNMVAATALLKSYWGSKGSAPVLETINRPSQKRSSGVFFTGGVDSLYTLKRNLEKIDYLVNIRGFDIKLADEDRITKASENIKNVASLLGKDVIFVDTNLRTHKLFRTLPWEKVFVAALAAVGHMLKSKLERIYVAGGYLSPPAGSTKELDVLWSSSELEIINEGDPKRQEKIDDLIDWAPMQKSVSVCWEHRSQDLNCGRCEKCIRTQLGIHIAGGELNNYAAFPKTNIVRSIWQLGFIYPKLHGTWWDMHQQTNDPAIRRAISWTIRRTQLFSKLARVGLSPSRIKRAVMRR